MGRPDYSMVTRHRSLWPLIEYGAVAVYILRELALRHEQRNAARCHASHCAHH